MYIYGYGQPYLCDLVLLRTSNLFGSTHTHTYTHTHTHTHTHTTHTHTHTGAPATTAVCGEEVEKYKAATRYSEKHSTETNSISREQKDGRSSRDRWYAGRVAYNAKPCTESMQLTISSVHIELLRPPAWHNCST